MSVEPAAGPRRTRTRLWQVAAGLLGVLALGAAAVPVLVPSYVFPRPGGPFGIGTLTYHWTDTTRPDVLSADPHALRELVVQLWYPARPDPAAPRAPYIADADAVESALARLQGYPRFLFGGLGATSANAVTSAPPVTNGPAFPVLIFLAGLTGYRQMNTFQVEKLVSHGYAGAAVDQPDIAADVVLPDDRHAGAVPRRRSRHWSGRTSGRSTRHPRCTGVPSPTASSRPSPRTSGSSSTSSPRSPGTTRTAC